MLPNIFALLKSTFILSAFLLLGATCFIQCKQEANTLFREKSSDETGVHFSNVVDETDTFNILTYEYIYNGGGVGIGDFNNDGLEDLIFAGNEVANRIYLNQGHFKFQDITESAKINMPGRWSSGVGVADINNDGWLDIYVCATTNPDSTARRNMLFINQGLDAQG